MLFEAGLQFGDPPEVWNLTQPELIRRIHRGYLDAGSRILLTNTFGGNRLRLSLTGHEGRVAEFNRTAAILLRAEVDAAGGSALVAGDIGPSGQIMAPLGTLEFDEAVDIVRRAGGGARGRRRRSHLDRDDVGPGRGPRRDRRRPAGGARLPIIATMTFDTRGHTMMGVTPEGGHGADRLGRRRDRRQLRKRPRRAAAGPREDASRGTRCRPRREVERGAARADRRAGRLRHRRADHGRLRRRDAGAGARIIGGCCGSTPAHLAAMAEALAAPGAAPVTSRSAPAGRPRSARRWRGLPGPSARTGRRPRRRSAGRRSRSLGAPREPRSPARSSGALARLDVALRAGRRATIVGDPARSRAS